MNESKINWLSPSQVVTELNLKPDGETNEDILRCLRNELAKIHPDKTNGSFSNGEHEERWHKLTSAKAYLDSVTNQQVAMIARDLIHEIQFPRSNLENPFSPLLRTRLDFAIADQTAKLVLERLQQEHLIKELPRTGLEQIYEIPEHIVEELNRHKSQR